MKRVAPCTDLPTLLKAERNFSEENGGVVTPCLLRAPCISQYVATEETDCLKLAALPVATRLLYRP